MPRESALSPQDRDFFRLVAQTAFSNPFSDTRAELDSKIAGVSPTLPHDELVWRMVREISKRVQALEDAGHGDVRCYGSEDRDMVESAFLFEAFHRFLRSFDQLIRDQMAQGDSPAPVPFANRALAMLARRGFVPEAARIFATFFQLRRAYYFTHHGLVGRSPCMKELRARLWNNVFTHDIRLYGRHLWNRMEDFSTLLLGETGTGKGTAAAAIGRSGFIPFDEKKARFTESFTRSFVAINLSQYPETLIESELFGHVKGAFTGAIDSHEGIFARGSAHGAVLLDEIGEVSARTQIKLLQVLQERTFVPVGSHQTLRFRGRVIAATNRPLDQLRSEARFRDDFYYRMCSDVITVPPLRQRIREDPAELDALLDHVLVRIIGAPADELLERVRSTLHDTVQRNYAWPGNVRELEQAVRRILLTRHYDGDVTAAAPDLQSQLVADVAAGSTDAAQLLTNYCALLYARHGTYEEVARRTNLDRRTVKSYLARSGSAHAPRAAATGAPDAAASRADSPHAARSGAGRPNAATRGQRR